MDDRIVVFQSAPPAEARGDSDGVIYSRRMVQVSIRSPRRSEGRYAYYGRNRDRKPSFNPLPPPKRGEISAAFSCSLMMSGFNPLPPPKRGEIRARPPVLRRPECFNPLPPPKRGEIRRLSRFFHITTCFNPLPPPKRGEIHVNEANDE